MRLPNGAMNEDGVVVCVKRASIFLMVRSFWVNLGCNEIRCGVLDHYLLRDEFLRTFSVFACIFLVLFAFT